MQSWGRNGGRLNEDEGEFSIKSANGWFRRVIFLIKFVWSSFLHEKIVVIKKEDVRQNLL